MNRPLRRRHLFIWILFAIILPVGFVFAFIVIPDPVISSADLSHRNQPAPFSDIIFSHDAVDFLLNVRHEKQQYQIELIIKQPLTHPSTVLYLSTEKRPGNLEQAIPLGAIGTRGIYRFNLNKKIQHEYLLFHDAVKGETYHTLKIT